MIWMIHLSLTALMTLWLVVRERRYSAIRAAVTGMAFFAVAFYLDCIFSLIMESAEVRGAETLMQGLGIAVSKSIAITLLVALTAMGHDSEYAGAPQNFYPEEKTDNDGRETRWDWQYLDGLTVGITLFFLMLALGCRGFILPGTALTDSETNRFAAALLLLLFLTVLLTYYISLWIFRKRQYRDKIQRERDTKERETDIYLENVESNYHRTREVWHDLKNHISLLQQFLQEEKYEQMADYIRIFGEDVDSLTLPVKSGNLVVDSLLVEKAARARKENVAVELSLCDLSGLNLQPNEICALLGNLLDNALEANRHVPDGSRYLRVNCQCRETCYYIQVENAASRPAKRMDGIFLSAKSDRKNQVGHGLGLRSVERIVHGCGGELAVDSGEDRFTAVVRVPRD